MRRTAYDFLDAVIFVTNNNRSSAVKIYFQTLFTVLAFVPLSVSAEVLHYSSCTLKDGKTLADAQAWVEDWRPLVAWVEDWRPLVKSAGIDYKVRLLTGHAAPADGMLPNFAIEGRSSTLSSHAAAWEWWYSDAKAAKSSAQIESVADCGANSIYLTTE
jgi:hypothetical protein